MDAMATRRKSLSLPGIESNCPARSSVTSHYSDWATRAQNKKGTINVKVKVKLFLCFLTEHHAMREWR
jgi:hypothetical protein